MSVLIKTMTNLPEYCYECPCHDGESGYCQADKERRYSDYRPFWCPLVKISNDIYEDGKSDVLDKIRAEITEIAVNAIRIDEKWARGLYYAIKVIDKYINSTGAEGSEKE